MTAPNSVMRSSGDEWEQAGEAWGRRAADWSCLFEHYSVDLLLAMLPQLDIGPGVELLDIGCGAGFVARLAAATGAAVSGIDAAAELIGVARARTPDADLRVGSMFELPWPDASFDVALAINAIWGGCEDALAEAFRVLRPGASLGMTFWGAGAPFDLRACFKVFAFASPEEHLASMRSLNNIGVPGVAEAMLVSAGFEVVGRGSRLSVLEWPDADVAWRALSSIGPAVPSLRDGDAAAIKRDVMRAIEPCRDERGIYRFRNAHDYVIARKPQAHTKR